MAVARVIGRVLTVETRDDGKFGITLGPPPNLVWFVEQRPPPLGAEVCVVGREADKKEVGAGSLTVLEEARFAAPWSAEARRWLPDGFREAVRAAMRRPLFRYQEEGAAWLAWRLHQGKGAVLADEPGLGKTSQAIAAVAALNLYPAVVVCPTSVRDAWASELGYATQPPYVEQIVGRKGSVYGAHVMIVNYELLAAREVAVANTRPKVIIFDEAQYLKEPKPGQRHRAAVATRLGTWIKRPVLLTGTPLLNRPKELWRLLHIVEPKDFDALDDFMERYCRQPEADKRREAVAAGTAVVTSHGSASNLDELQVRTQPMMLRRLKRDVLQDLPSKRRDRSVVTLPQDIMLHYKAAEQDLIKWLRLIGQGARVPAAERNLALVKLTHLRRLAAIGKLKQAIPELLAARFANPNAEPLVVFAHHRDVVRGVAALAQQLRLPTCVIDGDTPPAQRGSFIGAFQTGQASVFCASYDAAGTGITLTRASEMWMVERTYVPSKLAQAEDRIHRVGQTRPVQITYLDAAGTVDDDIARALTAKQRLITGVVGDDPPAFTPDEDEAAEDDAIAEFVKRVELERGPALPPPEEPDEASPAS